MLIDRRAFAASLGLLGIGWRAAHGRLNMPRIGILLVENREPFASEFRAGLQEAGYSEGRNILLEFRSAGGKLAALGDLAAELVHLDVDILVASETPAVAAAKRATTTISL